MNKCSTCIPSVARICRKRIMKFYIILWRVEVSMFLMVNCRHTRTCYLKLKLSRKLFLRHSWAIIVWIISSNNEYALKNAIPRHFHWKINNCQLNEMAQKKSANAQNLTAKFECDTRNTFRQIDISFQCVYYWSWCKWDVVLCIFNWILYAFAASKCFLSMCF